MRQIILILITSLIGISCFTTSKMDYSINKEKIELYRKSPINNDKLLGIIENSKEFINQKTNPAIFEATLEHHLIEETTHNNGNKTFIVFEYFALEGVSCNIKAVTIDNKSNLKSIFRLANYEEYPDGGLNEKTIVENDFATRTTVVKGIQGIREYHDSSDELIMRVDSTILIFKLNNFNTIETVDSVFRHYEYVEE